MPAQSGDQHVITLGDQRAVVTEVGATLRTYDVADAPVVWGFPEDEMASGGRGQVLAPWPNRIANGRYVFEGVEGRVPLDEIEHHNAIHGLVRWLPFRPVFLEPAAVRLEVMLHPQPAYPFDLRIAVEYRLVPDGLEVLAEAHNIGDRRAPFGLGFHDYFDAGPAGADAVRLDLRADRRLVLDGRLLPVGVEDVAGTPYAVVDAARAPIGALRLDDCFGGLRRDSDGRWRATLVRGDGPVDTIEIWADAAYKWAMVYTGDTLTPALRRRAVAIEPMTCPPNAFRTGEDVIVLDPGATFAARWGVRLPRLAG